MSKAGFGARAAGRFQHGRRVVDHVDDHFSVGRAGDFDAPVLQVRGNRADGPVAVPDVRRFGEKVGPSPHSEALLGGAPACQQLVDSRAKTPSEVLNERQRRRREHPFGALDR